MPISMTMICLVLFQIWENEKKTPEKHKTKIRKINSKSILNLMDYVRNEGCYVLILRFFLTVYTSTFI